MWPYRSILHKPVALDFGMCSTEARKCVARLSNIPAVHNSTGALDSWLQTAVIARHASDHRRARQACVVSSTYDT